MRFWLLEGKSAVKRYGYDCLYCKKQRAKPSPPRMAALPERRVTPFLPPFTHTVIDLFVPLYVKHQRSEVKKWGDLFCSANVRAVHLEIVELLETDAFLNGFSRFVNRRGYPKTFTTDRGTNFSGAARELKEGWVRLSHERISQKLSANSTEWIFKLQAHPT